MIRREVDGQRWSFTCDSENEAKVLVGWIDREGFRFQLDEFRVSRSTSTGGVTRVLVRIMIIGEGESERLMRAMELAA